MSGNPLNLWKSKDTAGGDEIELVLDRRQGERRQRAQSVDEERRVGERRRPQPIDFSEVRGFLGEGVQLKGELTFEGAVRLEGLVEGTVVRGEVLIIGERGHVNCAVDVAVVQVSGQVDGNISARQRVELLASSRVTGTIRTPCLVIWKGAVFNGRCEMVGAQPVEAEPQRATAPAAEGTPEGSNIRPTDAPR